VQPDIAASLDIRYGSDTGDHIAISGGSNMLEIFGQDPFWGCYPFFGKDIALIDASIPT
jgi:hypothetical protein